MKRHLIIAVCSLSLLSVGCGSGEQAGQAADFAAYIAVQEALARDDLDGARQALQALQEHSSGPVKKLASQAATAQGIAAIRRVDERGIVTTIAGKEPVRSAGALHFSGDGGPATEADLSAPSGIALDGEGGLIIADERNNVVRRVDRHGTITTIAGTEPRTPSDTEGGFGGDGGPATEAKLRHPSSVAVDATGNVYIADSGNRRVRKVDAQGFITTTIEPNDWGFSNIRGPTQIIPPVRLQIAMPLPTNALASERLGCECPSAKTATPFRSKRLCHTCRTPVP